MVYTTNLTKTALLAGILIGHYNIFIKFKHLDTLLKKHLKTTVIFWQLGRQNTTVK